MTGVPATLWSGAPADVALVPGGEGILDPVVAGHGNDGLVGVAEVDLGGPGEGGFQFGPPGVVEGAHGGDLFGVLAGDVLLLARIGHHVVELLAIDEAPALGHDGRGLPLDGIADALGIGDEEAGFPTRLAAGFHEALEGHPVELEGGGFP